MSEGEVPRRDAAQRSADHSADAVGGTILTVAVAQRMTPAERQVAADARTTGRADLPADVAARLLGDDDEILARLARHRARAS